MSLEQKYLNVPVRAESYMEIMMLVPDNAFKISNATSNDVLQYSDISSLKDIKRYTSSTIATLEENLWLLNGQFVNPTEGRKYDGYISNSMSDEEGHFSSNPIINLDIDTTGKDPSHELEYFTVMLNPAVKTGYPKEMKITFYNSSDDTVEKHLIIDGLSTLPNVTIEPHLSDIKKISIEFIDTVTPKRRIRVSGIVFGKIVTLTQDEVIDTDYYDKCSYTADTIPTRTFSFKVENYDKRYNIDNPDNSYLDLDRQTTVMIRNGYNIYGYDEEAKEIINEEGIKEIEWDDWKELRLLNISTGDDDTCTFEAGSILDMMTDVYSTELFASSASDNTSRKVRDISSDLLDFMGLPTTTVQFSSDDNGKSYGDYEIDTVLPESPVNEIFQLLAFSIGATLLIKDDGHIQFANLQLDKPASFTHHHQFTYTDFTSIPRAEQLENTTKISLPKYHSSIDKEVSDIQTFDISTTTTELCYSPCVPTEVIVSEDDTSGGSVQSATLYTRKGTIITSVPDPDNPVKVIVKGHKIETKQTQDRSVTNDTLIIDTKLMKDDQGNTIKQKYRNWYGKKFKYVMNTRGEPLVDAADYIEMQTPFSGDTSLVKGFILVNHIVFNGAWSGDMEVVAL